MAPVIGAGVFSNGIFLLFQSVLAVRDRLSSPPNATLSDFHAVHRRCLLRVAGIDLRRRASRRSSRDDVLIHSAERSLSASLFLSPACIHARTQSVCCSTLASQSCVPIYPRSNRRSDLSPSSQQPCSSLRYACTVYADVLAGSTTSVSAGRLTLLACLGLLFCAIPFALFFYGERIRKYSKYARLKT